MYKKDHNHNLISDIFKSFGWTVIDTSWSRGRLLDIIIYKSRREFWFVEIKNGKKTLTPAEVWFFNKHMERSILMRSAEEAKSWCENRQ